VKHTASTYDGRQTVIYTNEQLKRLSSLRNFISNPMPIVLKLPELTPEERIRWQIRLNRQSLQCGCHEGAFAIFLAEAIYVAYLLAGHSAITIWGSVGIGLGLAFVAGLVGKSVGLLRAQLIYRSMTRQILAVANSRRILVQ
jgi:hypothetical protein